MSKGMHHLLSREDKGVYEAKKTPAIMWRSILRDLQVSPKVWDRLIDRYVKKHGQDNKNTQSSDRGNHRRALARDDIGRWRTLQLGLEILAPKSISYELYLEWDPVEYAKEKPEYSYFAPTTKHNHLREIFQKLIGLLNLTPSAWDLAIRYYVDQIGTDNPTEIGWWRSNIHKQIFSKGTVEKNLTWKMFCRGLKILRVRKMDFIINLEFSRKTTRHIFYVDISEEDQVNDDD